MVAKSGNSGSMQVDTDLVRELAAMLNDTGLSEIEVEDGERKIRVSRNMTAVAAPMMAAPVAAAAAAPAPAAAAAPSAPASSANALKSPMVGTAYLTPEPDAAPFVSVGQQVKAGDTVMIIEAMKVMNPITATKATTMAIRPAAILSAPSSGPMVRSSRKSSPAGKAPARKSTARLVDSSRVKLPVMMPEPPAICAWITGAEITSSSSTIAKGLPMLLAV